MWKNLTQLERADIIAHCIADHLTSQKWLRRTGCYSSCRATRRRACNETFWVLKIRTQDGGPLPQGH